MIRRHLAFRVGADTLVGTLDSATVSGAAGLLIVSGGTEIRSGSWGGQARLAALLARQGIPVFRFDRRGVGDSTGTDHGFRHSAEDIAAALAAFRTAAPHLNRITAFGNCDAASALMLHGADLPLDALVLANPWTVDDDAPDSSTAGHAPAALRRYYLRRLADPRAVLRLLAGRVRLGRLLGGLRRSATADRPTALATAMARGLGRFAGPVTVLLAEGDRTAQLFAGRWPADDPRLQRHPTRSHSFSDPAARDWLLARLAEACANRH